MAIFTENLIEPLKVFLAGILIYVIIFSILQKFKPISESKHINSLISIIAAIFVSLTGIISYTISYGMNIFSVIILTIFFIITILAFLGVDGTSYLKGQNNSNVKIFVICLLVLFSVIMLKAFFSINNVFDTSNPQDDPYAINPEFNIGYDDIVTEENSKAFFDRMDNDTVSAFLFLTVIVIFALILAKST